MRQLNLTFPPTFVADQSLIAHGEDAKVARVGGISNLQPGREQSLTNAILSPMHEPAGFTFTIDESLLAPPVKNKVNHRPGQFRYSYGRKIQPADRFFAMRYKIDDYD